MTCIPKILGILCIHSEHIFDSTQVPVLGILCIHSEHILDSTQVPVLYSSELLNRLLHKKYIQALV